ncbi:hypothetical protein ACU4GR_32170 [Methylobacterium oryzae CBMB20]
MWTREIPFIDPVAAATRLRALPGLAFLDSAMRHDPLGRHSIVAADPFARFRLPRRARDPRRKSGSRAARWRRSGACLEPYRLEPGSGRPFPGGAIGLPGLRSRRGSWSGWRRRPGGRGSPTTSRFNLYDTALVDRSRRRHGPARRHRVSPRPRRRPRRGPRGGAARPLRRPARRRASRRSRASAGPAETLVWRSNFDRQSYEAAVEKVRAYIRAGDIYQANIAQRFVGRPAGRASTRSLSTGGCARPTRRPSAPIWSWRA